MKDTAHSPGEGDTTARRHSGRCGAHRSHRFIPVLGHLVLASGLTLLAGCATAPGSGVAYHRAVAAIEARLESKVDNGIFPFTKEEDEGQTVFRFIEGDRNNKVDHATPLRVKVAVARLPEGEDSAFSVEAFEHGLFLKKRDRGAEERWLQEMRSALAGQ